MTSAASVFILTCLIVGETAQTVALESSSSVRHERLETGETLTLQCLVKDDSFKMFYWFKQPLGEKLRPICSFNKHGSFTSFSNEFKDNPRFTVYTQNGTNYLTISDLQMSDSAIYHCITADNVEIKILVTITVSVEGSGVSVPALVHQSESETIQPGGSVTLNCTVHTGTCDGEHSVYWFTNSEEAHPGLIYTHGGRNDQCERNPHSHTHTCVYNLPIRSLNLSHAGTYYCAVVSCGHILFGNGTKLDFKDDKGSLVVYILSTALAFTTILAVFLAYNAFIMYKTTSCSCTGPEPRTSAAPDSNAEDTENLHYAALRKNHANRSTRPRQRDDSWPECVYSGVRQ